MLKTDVVDICNILEECINDCVMLNGGDGDTLMTINHDELEHFANVIKKLE